MTRLTTLMGTAALALASTTAFAADPDLLVFDWSGYEEEGFFINYAEKHGSGPTYAFFGEEEEAFQKLRSGFKADVAHPCSQSVDKWFQAGLIEPWDLSKIPTYETLADIYKTDPTFVRDGEVYFIPADLGMTGIAYNADEVTAEQVSSLQIFLDPEMAGRVSLPDNVDDAYALAYLATGTSDWTKATEEDFKKASDWLRQAHANNRAYWADGAELAQLMATGEVLVAWSWNETPVQMVGDGYNIAFEREAAEGSSSWFCGYVNLVDGPGSEDKAHDFIESFLSQETADYIVNEWGYGHSNTAAMSGFGEETLTEVGLNEISAPQLAQLPMDTSLREQMIKEFERIKAGF
ncbi:spermidine/putrescine transport system substrate-binding protein [Litoreibacter ponti]|uniref:Spermidine/putrescine transport system substrate-binding protein n=1 Tax=Litoreibacter ponti TaxID=1510457 RepID=A0A2T6BJF2_9RHOB|nr:extracellular solute-binding protein [Litoreibacter ponti]PTX56190.1 spermidine/putrescine transport system substrate-binding protein [Litoreibacter ponti]